MPSQRGQDHNDRADVDKVAEALRQQDYERAEYIFNRKETKKVKTFANLVINDCAKRGDIAGAGWVAVKLVRLGIQPTSSTFNGILAACTKMGDLKLSEEWWVRMTQAGVEPNLVSYNTVLHTCTQARDTDSAVSWMNALINSNIRPCKISFSAIINSFAKAGKLSEAEEWFYKMEEMDVDPDNAIFNTLICACAKQCNAERAEHWLRIMHGRNLLPDQKTYNGLINVCAKTANFNKAIALFEAMGAIGVDADVITFGSLLHACQTTDNLAKAEELMLEMQRRGIRPNGVCFNTIISCCLKAGAVDKALFWFAQLRLEGLRGPLAMHNNALSTCMKEKRFDLVEAVLCNIFSDGYNLDSIALSKLKLQDTHNWAQVTWGYKSILCAAIQARNMNAFTYWLSKVQHQPHIFNECHSHVYYCASQEGWHEAMELLFSSSHQMHVSHMGSTTPPLHDILGLQEPSARSSIKPPGASFRPSGPLERAPGLERTLGMHGVSAPSASPAVVELEPAQAAIFNSQANQHQRPSPVTGEDVGVLADSLQDLEISAQNASLYDLERSAQNARLAREEAAAALRRAEEAEMAMNALYRERCRETLRTMPSEQ
eukprot:TRINITY_DN17683_c0_g1_i1.p1 TRINITY_DN17683_c0_g1~~TRINITY_DN17683_c0_g1_i1.p1  ORF type:complete len:610 (-),score=85.34 TRINITY_DN17683_c0_g1_i1:205-2010(-)